MVRTGIFVGEMTGSRGKQAYAARTRLRPDEGDQMKGRFTLEELLSGWTTMFCALSSLHPGDRMEVGQRGA